MSERSSSVIGGGGCCAPAAAPTPPEGRVDGSDGRASSGGRCLEEDGSQSLMRWPGRVPAGVTVLNSRPLGVRTRSGLPADTPWGTVISIDDVAATGGGRVTCISWPGCAPGGACTLTL